MGRQLGRPGTGSPNSFPSLLVDQLAQLRREHSGWGATTLRTELALHYDYELSELPSLASINRYLKAQGFMKAIEVKARKGKFPCSTYKAPTWVHALWELDAQGAIEVGGIGHQAMINIKDVKSRKHCMAFPIAVTNSRTQPSFVHYQWALRLAFLESGLPQAIQVDKDSVFFENSTKSPYPRPLHLWLTALGIDFHLIDVPPPQKQAIVERAHQTMERQAVQGQHFKCWKYFFQYCNLRRQRLNEHLPNRSLNQQAPLQAFPQAIHSGQAYALEQEQQLLDVNRVYQLLEKGVWYRLVSGVKTISLGRKIYYLKHAQPKTQLQISFCANAKQFIFRDANERVVASLPPKGIKPKELMATSTKELKSTYRQIFWAKNPQIT